MTPVPNAAPSAPWWQTLAASALNLAVGALVQHFLGNTAAGATVAAGTAIAHALPSPTQSAVTAAVKRRLSR